MVNSDIKCDSVKNMSQTKGSIMLDVSEVSNHDKACSETQLIRNCVIVCQKVLIGVLYTIRSKVTCSGTMV